MTSFTPGPWEVINGYYPGFKEVSGPSFKISCVMSAIDITEADYLKRIADLSLIAAAPELLEALQEMMEYAGIIEERCDSIATNKARAAIAKATS